MGCTVFLVRHGPAEGMSAAQTDEERHLSPEGREKIERAASGLLSLGVAPEVILASPLVRARETAEILGRTLAPEVALEATTVLAPGSQIAAIIDALGNYSQASQIILTGHQPTMGELASTLLSGWPGLLALPFKPGGIAAIDLVALPPKRQGSLSWFMTAEQLGAIGSN